MKRIADLKKPLPVIGRQLMQTSREWLPPDQRSSFISAVSRIYAALKWRLERHNIHFGIFFWTLEGAQPVRLPQNATAARLQFRFLSDNDIDVLGELDPKVFPRSRCELMKREGKDGDRYLAAIHDNEIAAFNTIRHSRFRIDGVDFELDQDEIFLSGMFTRPEFRGKNIAAYLRTATYEFLSEQGTKKIFSATYWDNIAAIKFKQKVKARFRRLILQIGFGNSHNYFWTLRRYR